MRWAFWMLGAMTGLFGSLLGQIQGGQTRGFLGGALEFVDAHTITLRLPSGDLVDAAMNATLAQDVAKRFTIGDAVEVDAITVPPAYDPAVQHFIYQRALSVSQNLGPGRTAALASLAWRGEGNLLHLHAGDAPPAPPAAPHDDAVIAQTRQAVLHYVTTLPDYIAHEVVKRTEAMGVRQKADTVESEVTLEGLEVSRGNVIYNDTAWNKPFNELPGFNWNAAYSIHLLSIFAPECGGVFKPNGKSVKAGHNVLDYSFTLPRDRCVQAIRVGALRFFPGEKGDVFINPDDHLILELDEAATGLPDPFPIGSSEDKVTWDYVDVGAHTQPLETASELKVWNRAGTTTEVKCSYNGYHAFRATTRIVTVGH